MSSFSRSAWFKGEDEDSEDDEIQDEQVSHRRVLPPCSYLLELPLSATLDDDDPPTDHPPRLATVRPWSGCDD